VSVLSPAITHVAVDGALYPGEVEDKNILAVPTVYLNGAEFGQGRMTVEQILSKIDTSSTERLAASLSGRDPFEVLVVGAGPAGVSAAIYAARKGIRTGLVGERIGGQVLDTMAIENLISVPYTEGPKPAAELERHAHEYEIDIMTGHRAARLIPAGSPEAPPGSDCHQVEIEGGAVLTARTVIIATGARWRQLGVPGETEHRNYGVTYCPRCDGPLFKGKRVAVVGGGNSGVEAPIDLAGARVARDATGVRRSAPRRRRAPAQAREPAPRRDHRQRPDHRGRRGRDEGHRPVLHRPGVRGEP
jgi:alkyl hydroperoxide reductase subunit F